MTYDREHIEAIITRKLAGVCSEKELAELNTWLEADPINRQYFQDLKKIYDSAAFNTKMAEINVDEEWKVFKASIKVPESGQSMNKSWLRIAASIVIISVLGYLIWTNAFKTDTVTIYANDTPKTILLPDSTIVTLNYNSTLTYERVFGNNERHVSMEGEAFFEVKRDESRPFIVALGHSEVEVLGTSFNIKALEKKTDVIVTVNSGRVRFTETKGNSAVVLEKGEKGILMKNSNILSKVSNTDINFKAWKTREIVFDNVSLDVVIQTLNRIYNANISIATQVSDDCKVTVTFENQSLESVLAVLELTLNLEYRKNGDIIEVVKADC